jgi:AraC-like DNA-binding protein
MGEITYDQRPPSAVLASFVECYWSLSGDAQAAPREPERVLPDGRVEIVLNTGSPVWQTIEGTVRRQPAAILVGPTSRSVFISPTGAMRMLGIRFRHGGAHALLGAPLAEFADTIISLEDAGRALPATLLEELAEAPDFDSQVRIVERHLLYRLRDRSARDVASAVAVRLILTSAGAMDVARVARHTGVSTRQLGRRFLREVGVGPKVLARLARFHSLLRVVTTDRPPTLAAAAARAGYVDQSHLVRDCREFSGQTPSEYFRHDNRLSSYFLDLTGEPSLGQPGAKF